MKFFIGDQEKEFFHLNGLLAIESVFSSEEIDAVQEEMRMKVISHGPKDLALHGGAIQKFLFSKKLAQVAFELAGAGPLRYGYDLFFMRSAPPEALFTSVSPIEIGVCIALDGESTEQKNPLIPFTLRQEDLLLQKGSVVFFSPSTLFSLKSSTMRADARYLLLVYSGVRAQYLYQPNDPYTHDLKRLGYVFGDRLKSVTHPTLYK